MKIYVILAAVVSLIPVVFSKAVKDDAEVRFYTVKDLTEKDSTNEMSSGIQDLLAMGQEASIFGKTVVESPQCKNLHKWFNKYKREFNSDQSMADETWHSISSSAYVKVLSPVGTRVPLGIKAEITKDMIGCDGNSLNSKRFSFWVGSGVNTQMEAMEMADYDQKGRLIPAWLCGPPKWYNIAPQHPKAYEKFSSHEDTKTLLKKWLTREGGKVEVLVVLEYKNLKRTKTNKGLPEGSRRPDGFSVCYRLFDKEGTLKAEQFGAINNNY